MDFKKEPPVGPVAATVAKAVNISAALQSMAVGALPSETVEGLLVATETAILLQKVIGALSEQDADAIRRRIADWGRETLESMERDGTVEKIQQHHKENVEKVLEILKTGDGNYSGPN